MSVKLDEAVEIITSLSEETDDIKIKESLKLALYAVNELKNRSDRRNNRPESFGLPWTEESESRIITLFKNKTPIKEIAHKVGRSEGAVTRKLIIKGELADFKESRGR